MVQNRQGKLADWFEGLKRQVARSRVFLRFGLIAVLAATTLGLVAIRSEAQTPIMVPSTTDHVIWGELFKPDSEPIMRVSSGDVIQMETISHEVILPDQGNTVDFLTKAGIKASDILSDQLAVKARVPKSGPGPHVITGPVYVEGAEPGDVLEVKTLQLDYRVPYGVISNRHGKGSLPNEYPQGDAQIYTKVIPLDTAREVGIFRPENDLPDLEIPLYPFMGIMGVVPADPEETVNSVPPGAYGGNIDIKHLTAGSSLYLPVQVPGALFYSGDPHCAQGNGEVALTAIECSLTPTFELTVHKDMSLNGPVGETPESWLAIGLDEDLDEAMKASVREYLRIVNDQYGLTKPDALLYASAAIDFEVSQVVDIVKGIHGVIPKAAFAPLDK
ncbi:acetamidase/formamidase family protein [Romeria aff. gracilis LEGE 07310]|uniref:Acetamidase/formamidase family protein n=1 Tax=Vasconcelosia minhoensis LEGE 07310 TaxID=915328 RepID=A0A8J7AM98_9CYAN|nr:acetamidase/formamidase family protein [Romeria gracilis]MBE9077049.1 acetamidase/formamidase family protein [Romeria aff. gracilis LEGE 07310]